MIIENGIYTVYYHINKVNGKIYVGITSQTVKQRWKRDGAGYIGCDHFYRAILKYGWDGFQHHIFASNLTMQEACNMERILIDQLKTNDENFGYNILQGGECKHLPDETKRKISQSMKQTSKSQKHIDRFVNMIKSRDWSNENGGRARPVKCVQTGEVFPTAKQAAEAKHISGGPAITNVLKGRKKTTGGYHWQYAQI